MGFTCDVNEYNKSGLDHNDCESSLVHMLTLCDTSLYGQKSSSTYFTNRRGTTDVFEIVKLSSYSSAPARHAVSIKYNDPNSKL